MIDPEELNEQHSTSCWIWIFTGIVIFYRFPDVIIWAIFYINSLILQVYKKTDLLVYKL